MKKIAVLAAFCVATASVALAGPKDKVGEALVNPSALLGNASWDNAPVAGTVKSNKCKYQISAKANPVGDLADGPVICFAEADVYNASLGVGLFGNSVVLAGTASGGKLSMKADLRAIGCGVAGASTAVNGTTICFGEDVSVFNPMAQCGGAGMLWVPANLLPGTTEINGGAALGVCQGVAAGAGERIPRPAVPVLAEQGTHQPQL